MIPYIKYLYCLFLTNNDEETIIGELNKYGLPSKKVVLDLAYDRFLQKLEAHSKSFSSCLSLYDDEFEACAKLLEIDQYFDDRVIKHTVFRIVSDPLIKKHIECSILTRVAPEIIIEDVKGLYRTEFVHGEIMTFNALFFDDAEVADTNSFIKYADLLPPDERTLKNKCRAQGGDYTRWALGVPVNLNVKQMAKEMMADAYFRYKEAYSEKSPEAFEKAVRLGNLVTKLIDREVKLSEPGEGKEKSAQSAFGEQLCLFDFPEEQSKTLTELNEDNNKPDQ